MTSFASHKDIIALWPSTADYAADIGVPENTANLMRWRKSIGPDHWAETVVAAKKRGFEGITLELLLELRPSKKVEKEKATFPPDDGPLFRAGATG